MGSVGLLACDDEDDDGDPNDPPNGGDVVDLTAFEGCWHLQSFTDVFGPPGTPCRRALDSVAALFEIDGRDSIFAVIDTVTDLSFVPPYRGTGDYAGTNIPGRKGEVLAEFRHANGTAGCSLVTTLDGPLFAEADTGFSLNYILRLQFIGESPCDSSDCSGIVTFHGTRRPDGRCTP
jgi:hypothetical protein